jgi:hypothetical protein
VGLEVKHRELARQVEVFIEHSPENSMASFHFTSVVLGEGTTLIFGSWICIANGSGGFNNHLANSRESETPTATQRGDLDEFIDNLDEMLLPGLAREIEEESCGRTNLNHIDSSTRVLAGGLPRTSNGIIPLVCRVTSR